MRRARPPSPRRESPFRHDAAATERPQSGAPSLAIARFACDRRREEEAMRNVLALAAAVAAACPAPAGAETGRHIVGITEGDAHRQADAECRPLAERARVHMFLNNGLA